ncbi:hypothetical protein SUGI_0625380 [Cryptomeria japonica]|nr:hypothetical protein SUGI_0625380 [Cryptomeria japonica]
MEKSSPRGNKNNAMTQHKDYAAFEEKTAREAANTVTEITVNAFMIAGAPRPVRAKRAKAEMFSDRPALPGRRIRCYWVDSSDPDWEAAMRRKQLAKKHISEAAYLLKHQREEEEKLSEQHEETLRTNYRKYEMIESLYADGTNEKLSRRYDTSKDDEIPRF